MSPARLAEINHQIRLAKDGAPGRPNADTLRGFASELLTELTAATHPWPPPSVGAAPPGELFTRDHCMAQASPEFQLETAVSLIQSYAHALTHTPNAQEVYSRLTAELRAGAAAAELIALKHETEWTVDERRTMTRRKWLTKARRMASHTGAYTASARELAAEGVPPK